MIRARRAWAVAARILLLAVWIGAAATHAAWAQPLASGPTVRVLLDDALPLARIEIVGPHHVRTPRGSHDAAHGLTWPLVASEGAIVAGSGERAHPVGAWIELTPERGTIAYDGRVFRGGLRVEAIDGGLRVVNALPLEAYLRGVVPAEMSASWPIEALKAQAVAARSYTLASLDPTGPYDLCATDRCQVYRGVAAEHPRSDRAVAETEGIVIAVNGVPAAAYYHADSGGVVASSAEVWGRALPYLRSRTDVSVVSPHRAWTARLDPSRLAAALASEGFTVGTPSALTVLERSGSGRVVRAAFDGSSGRAVVAGPALTRVLRDVGLKSTRIVVTGPLAVRGDGWGHGVGMSQYGARALAEQGYDYGRILAFYYPGVGLQQRIYRSAGVP